MSTSKMASVTKVERKEKTLWQKIYSFLGFWTYTDTVFYGEIGWCREYTVIYWCALGFSKVDLIRIFKREYNFEEDINDSRRYSN